MLLMLIDDGGLKLYLTISWVTVVGNLRDEFARRVARCIKCSFLWLSLLILILLKYHKETANMNTKKRKKYDTETKILKLMHEGKNSEVEKSEK